MAKFNFQVTRSPASSSLSTRELFDSNYTEEPKSPIDRFNEHIIEVNKLFPPDQLTKYSSQMLVLSYVSLVESYLREVLRKVIVLDETAQKACENMSITYGAALVSADHTLAEAILESYSFAGKRSIVDAFKSTLGIGGHYPQNLLTALDEFDRICQVRHCLVHRFGFMGTKNIISLGMKEHKEFVSKPFNPGYAAIQEIALVCTNAVKECNQFLCNSVLSNTVQEKTVNWTWNYRRDRKQFKAYFEIFHSSLYHPNIDEIMKNCYQSFRAIFRDDS